MLAQSMCVGEAFDAVDTVVPLDTVMKGVDVSAESETGAEALVAGGESTGQHFHIYTLSTDSHQLDLSQPKFVSVLRTLKPAACLSLGKAVQTNSSEISAILAVPNYL